MSEDQELLLRIAATAAARDSADLQVALAEAAAQGLAVEVDELLLQSILFLGYPVALEAMTEWRKVSSVMPAPPMEEGPRSWAERGARVCQEVYGDQYGRLRENIRSLHPDAETWMVTHGYGRVLGRPGLDLVTRELAIVAQLAVLGAPRQLYSHARGALRVGASLEDVENALAVADRWIPDPFRSEVGSVWSEVRSRVTSAKS